MEIVIIGTGNTATILALKLHEAGHRIVQVYGRDAASASELAYRLDTESTNYWSVVTREADLYILAVNDISVEEVVRELNLPEKIIVHTAASVSRSVLKSASDHHGVFYPLQSLRKNADHLPEIPILIDASDGETRQLLRSLGESISGQVFEATEDERLKLHLAAVFCNNFVNHLYRLAEDYCKKEKLDFKLLIPLICETAGRMKEMSPSEAQTGPALRGDDNTINKHMVLLENYPEMKKLYEAFSEGIRGR